jgi:hypothetical protein
MNRQAESVFAHGCVLERFRSVPSTHPVRAPVQVRTCEIRHYLISVRSVTDQGHTSRIPARPMRHHRWPCTDNASYCETAFGACTGVMHFWIVVSFATCSL